MGTTIKSEADKNDQPTETRGLDAPQLQATVSPPEGPIKTNDKVILQGEAQTPLPSVGKKAVEDMTDEELKVYLKDRASKSFSSLAFRGELLAMNWS